MINDNLNFERKLWAKGYLYIGGVDEAGRGPLAGPVVAAAVILPQNFYHPDINDSKSISQSKREMLFELIKSKAIAYEISIVDVTTIDQINILEASRLAMINAVKNLKVTPDFVLTDYMDIGNIPHEAIKHGDQLSHTIAAASILAKVTRDQIMRDLDLIYPQYGFKDHKGYGTKKHLEALKVYGVTPVHRKTFKPVLKHIKL